MVHLTNFSFEFLCEIFTEDASLLFLYYGAKKSKMIKNSNQGGPALGQPPLEAILVMFGRRPSIFLLFERSWKKMKNDTTFVRMCSGDHHGDAKMSKKGTLLRRI